MYRQGDVALIPVKDHLNVGREAPRDDGRVILAYGEVSGHAHAFLSPNVALFRSDEAGMGGYVRVTDTPADLVHEEHDTISVPPGLYRLVRQREYDAGEARYVAD